MMRWYRITIQKPPLVALVNIIAASSVGAKTKAKRMFGPNLIISEGIPIESPEWFQTGGSLVLPDVD